MSYFWVYVVMATLVGNYLGYIIFFNGFITGFFVIMGCFSLFSSIYFAMLKTHEVLDREKIPIMEENDEDKTVTETVS